MRTIAVVAGLAACASAQLMPLSQIAGMPAHAPEGPTIGKGAGSESFPYNANVVFQSTYNSVFSAGKTSARRSIFQKRHEDGNCSPQPLGAGPVPTNDTPDGFLAYQPFIDAANGAQTPSGYVNTFKNLQASSQAAMGYLGYDSISSYDPSICSAKCNGLAGCFAFDIYFERDPTIDPGVNCTNPPSTTVIKCAYWGVPLEPDTATNNGQYCADFHMVIAGSNGYVQSKPGFTVPNYNGTFVGGAAIDAPTECNSYIGYQMWNDGQPFDPDRCAAACDATSAFNIQYLNSRAICRFFDTYVLEKNGSPVGQYCAMYTRSWDISYATNFGQIDTAGNNFTIAYSYIYSNTTDPGASVCDATCMSQKPCPSSNSSVTSTTSISLPSTSTSVGITTTSVGISTTSVGISTTPVGISTTPIGISTTPIGISTTSVGISTTPVGISTTSIGISTSVGISTTTSKASSLSTYTPTSLSSSTASTTKAASTTPVISTTSSAKSTTPTLTSTTTTKCTTTALYTTPVFTTPVYTTPSIPTTTKCTTTGFVTSTTKTTTSAATPTSTQCFRLKPYGPGYLPVPGSGAGYCGLDSASGKISWGVSLAESAIFQLDNTGHLTCGGKTISRTVEQWWQPSWGVLSSQGIAPVTCSKDSQGQILTCTSTWSGSNVWTNKGSFGTFAHGNCPGNGWDQAGMNIEYCVCPPGTSSSPGYSPQYSWPWFTGGRA